MRLSPSSLLFIPNIPSTWEKHTDVCDVNPFRERSCVLRAPLSERRSRHERGSFAPAAARETRIIESSGSTQALSAGGHTCSFGTLLLGKQESFPQVECIIPHFEKQYSSYRPKRPKTRLELTPSRLISKTADQRQYSPCRAKYYP